MLQRLLPVVVLVLTASLLPTGTAEAGTERAGPSWVVKLQRRLNALGCQAGPPDGVLGLWTRAAVVRFQSRHRLAMDGVPGPGTRRRLYADDAKRCDVRPVPPRTGSGRRIVLSQRQNWLWLVGSNGSVVAQGGLVDNPGVLRPGTYRTGSYCGRAGRIPRNGVPSGTLWLDNFVRFAPCGVGFHRIPRYVSSGAQIHPDWLLGTNFRESHGCIRLSQALSRRVWDFTVRPAMVKVVRG